MQQPAIINIGADKVPVGMVRSRFMKYTMSNILYVYSCMDTNITDIRNIHAYLLKALYDAPSTMAWNQALRNGKRM